LQQMAGGDEGQTRSSHQVSSRNSEDVCIYKAREVRAT
jgi:hypothetical protein